MSAEQRDSVSDDFFDPKQLAAKRLEKLNTESEKRKHSQKEKTPKTAACDSLLTSTCTDTTAVETNSPICEKQKHKGRHKKSLNNQTESETVCAGGILDKGSFTSTVEQEKYTVIDGFNVKKKERKRIKSEKQSSEQIDSVGSNVLKYRVTADTVSGHTISKNIDSSVSIDTDNTKPGQTSEELTLNKHNKKRKERHLNRKRSRETDVQVCEAVNLESDAVNRTLTSDEKTSTDKVNKGKKRRRSKSKGENKSEDEVSKRKVSTVNKSKTETQNSANVDKHLVNKEKLDTQPEALRTRRKRRRSRKSKVDTNDKNIKVEDSKSGIAVDKNNEGLTAAKDNADDYEDDHAKQIGGFTVLKGFKSKAVDKIQRRLPDWLAKPSIISADIQSNLVPFDDIPGLEPAMVTKLRENGIETFFPVQAQVIPALLDSVHSGVPFLVGKAGYRPQDICCSAPTGSGKTLAFVLPIVQALRSRVVCQVRALIVLPVQDLATQVYKVFLTYCEGTGLKVSLLTGQNTFVNEQKTLVKKSYRAYESLADITIATPGRLVDHINKTAGFDLRFLRFLVIDEADRMMDDIKQDWLHQLEAAVYCRDSVSVTGGSLASGGFIRHRPTALIAANATRPDIPLQKLLFSATLSHNPETLQRLSLFQPLLFTSVVQRQKTDNQQQQPAVTSSGRPGDQLDDKDEYIGKFTTPASLIELCVECTTSEKPLIVLYLLKRLKYRNVLCFTNTMEATHRLHLLLKFHGGIRVREFSSKLSLARRSQILSDFKTGKIQILICTDQMARGMDIENIRYVLSYDAPLFIKTYIHRVGRTARAGKPGTAVTLLEKTEMMRFRKLLSRAGKDAPELLDVTSKRLKPLVPGFTEALNRLPHALKRESRVKKSQPKRMKLSEVG